MGVIDTADHIHTRRLGVSGSSGRSLSMTMSSGRYPYATSIVTVEGESINKVYNCALMSRS